jgi:mRNA-decapping enzyme subunit 2
MDGTDDDNENIFRGLSFEEILEELIARFMVNLPRAEITPVRLYWQAEQA